MAALLAFGVLTALAQPARAGILSALAKFFFPAPAEVEEVLPRFIVESRAAPDDTPALDADNRPPPMVGDDLKPSPLTLIHENAIVAPLNPIGTLPPADGRSDGQIFIYTVRTDDTISSIAKSFDVSVSTILWANNIFDLRALKPGSQLVILPVTGVRHEAKAGDTVAGIARKYRASIADILQFNGLAPDETLAAGRVVIVPDGELPQAAPLTAGLNRSRSFSNLPLLEGFYARPIIGGRRSRGLHGYNGVDLADSCGVPVLASAGGTVLITQRSGWNGGYGRYVVVAHSNNTQTLYAHLKEVGALAGQSVRQGEPLGAVGSSGNSTGCHLHFEVRGARNPF